jgi:glycerophosphoryl diester phosphodiesterase
MKLIGHRGAAGLALENTKEAIQKALDAGVDGIEIDVRLTGDGYFVIAHDPNLGRVSDVSLVIAQHTKKQIKDVVLKNGENILTLSEAMRLCAETPLFIEAKGSDWAQPLANFLISHSSKNCRVISFNHRELAVFHDLCPEVPVYAVEQTNAVAAIQFAHKRGFTGVDLNYHILNPLSYWLARWYGLEIIVYTLNRPRLARVLSFLFPKVQLTTNFPDKLQFLRNEF